MAGKKLNKNVVIALALVVFLGVILASAIGLGRLKNRDPKHFVALAERYESEQQWPQAAVFYLKALERSKDPSHLVRYGSMMLNEGEIGTAVKAWQDALVQQPGLVSAHVPLLKVYLHLARLDGNPANWRKVEEAANGLLKLGEDKAPTADRVQAHHALGLALLNLAAQSGEDESRGVTELQAATSLAPEQSAAQIDLAEYYIRKDRSDEAEQLFADLLRRFVSPSADASKVRVAYGRYLAGPSKRMFSEADSVFQDAIRLASTAKEVRQESQLGYTMFLSQQWARALRNEKSSDEAEALFGQAETILNECITEDPDGFEAVVQLATLYTASGRHSQVVELCDKRSSRPFSRKGLEAIRRRLGYFNLMLLASESSAAQALAAGAAGDKVNEQQWFARAEQYVEKAKGEFPAHPRSVAQAGRLKVAKGQDRAALQDLRAADESYGQLGLIDWQNKMLLVRQHLKLGESGPAQAVMDEVLEPARRMRSGDTSFWLLYGQVLLVNNQFDRAMAMCERVLQLDAENRDARQLKAAVFERTGRLTEAGELHAEATGSGAIRAILRFRELERAGGLEQGLAVLRDALKQEPADVRLVVAATGALTNAGKGDEAAAVVARALAAKPNEPLLKKLALFTRKDLTDTQRDEALKDIIQAEPDAYQRALEWVAYHSRRKQLPEALAQVNEAERLLLARTTPLSQTATTSHYRELLLQKLRIASQAKDEAALSEVREAAARHNVDGAGGRTLLGIDLVYREELEPAIRAFREAVELQPTDAQALTYLGHCLANVGREEEAKTFFDRAVNVNPDEALAHRGLAALAQAAGDKEAYERAFTICKKLTPNDPWVQAELLARKEQSEPLSAIARREGLLAEKPNDLDNLRRLAALCESVKDLVKADVYYNRALELKPNDAAVAVSVAKYYRRTQRPDRALDLLTRFAESRPTEEEKAYALVLVAAQHLNQGDWDRAESTLLAAAQRAETLDVVQSVAEFYFRSRDDGAKALPWYEKAVSIAEKSQSPQLPHLLASRIGCMLHRGVQDTTRARRLVMELRAAYPDDLRGIFWDSEVHARAGNVEQAVATLSEYLKKAPDDASVLLHRAKQYLTLGRTALAIEDLERIKRKNPMALDLEPRILLAQLQARAGRNDAAIRELESLVQDVPYSTRAVEELVRLYLGAKRSVDAEKLVAAQVNRSPDVPDPRWIFLRGQVALQMGDGRRALADYQTADKLSGYSEESLWKVLDLFRLTGQFADGVRYYERRPATSPPSTAVLARLALLTARAGQSADAVNRFRDAMQKALFESLSAVRTITEDLDRAFAVAEAATLFASAPADARVVRGNERILTHLLRVQGRTEEAAVRLDQAIATSEHNVERAGLYYEKGEMLQIAGDTGRARTAYEECLRIEDRNWAAMNNLAFLLSEKLGEHESALAFAQRAVAIADTPDTLDTHGWVLVGLGRFPQAIAELSRAVRLDPNQAAPIYHLSEAYRRNGQFLEAGDLAQRGLELARASGDTALTDLLSASLEQIRRRETMVRRVTSPTP